MATSTLTVTVNIEHGDNIPDAASLTRTVARAIATEIGIEPYVSLEAFGRSAYIGAEIGSKDGLGVRARLDSAVVTRFTAEPV